MKSVLHNLSIFTLTSMLAVEVIATESVIETVVVDGRKINLLGRAVSASEGLVGQNDIAIRPLLRTGEVLELVPGMVVTQHSGTGKANQYFLRGFNLDHGTDFNTAVDGMPVNMRTHGHGQGYTDLNFLISETLGQLSYKKGAYYADVGDFSGAGGVLINTMNEANTGILEGSLGENNYARLLLIDNFAHATTNTLFAIEANRYDGPWSDIEEDLDKYNVFLKHTRPLQDGNLNISLMIYDNSWNSADQIPARAVSSRIIDKFGSLDDTVGGHSSRSSLNANLQKGQWQASAYIVNYQMNLWSNFTYFLDDEINGDQFEQVDDRVLYGGQFSYEFANPLQQHTMSNRLGLELRIDDIEDVGLYHTQDRQRLGAIRLDSVKETSLGLFWENRIQWQEQLRSVIGLRYDYYDFNVDDKAGINLNDVDLSANSGSLNDSLPSLKANLIYSFNSEWEGYISAGQGFHSNDARGTTIEIDPADGNPVEAVDPLVRSLGYETGLRAYIADHINTSISLWTLELDSELLFVGDAGNTEASRASKRSGLEMTTYYYLNEEWSFDFEYTFTDAEFTDRSTEGNEIPGAITTVVQAGVNADLNNGWFGALRFRYFGSRPLIEDGSVESDPATLWNLRIGYHVSDWQFKFDILNILDSADHDIDYYYPSRLNSEPSGLETEDIHFHVFEPRTIRASVGYQF